MRFNNLQIILLFITYISLVLSLPIKKENNETIKEIKATEKIQSVSDNLRIVEFKGDYGLTELINKKGFTTEAELIAFIFNYMNLNVTNVSLVANNMACSAFQVSNKKGNGYYFGRNFDWREGSDPLIVVTHPDEGYSSISTVNTDYIKYYSKEQLPDEFLKIISVYGPIDGLNEKGLSISINYVPGEWEVNQTSNDFDLTSSTLIRYLLDKADTVDKAIELIKKTNMHSSLGLLTHYLISDANGKSVSVEYINETDEAVITETDVMTNFYITDKLELGHGQDRYQIIKDMKAKYPNMDADTVKDTLERAKQNHTQWSVIYDQKNIEATYYILNDFKHGYHIKLFDDISDEVSDDETLINSNDEDSIQEVSDDEE